MNVFQGRIKSATVVLIAGVLISGCTKSASEIAPAYTSPLQYQNYSCDQLRMEAQRLSSRAAQLSGVQDDKADEDALLTAAAIVVFWPAAFFIGGNSENAAQLARIKGEFEAIEQVSIQKNCVTKFKRR